jgi:hypothetical protein
MKSGRFTLAVRVNNTDLLGCVNPTLFFLIAAERIYHKNSPNCRRRAPARPTDF